jgi:hypothetical protein
MDFLARLKKICAAYDERYGSYPESAYEGMAVYDFAEDYMEEREVEVGYTDSRLD